MEGPRLLTARLLPDQGYSLSRFHFLDTFNNFQEIFSTFRFSIIFIMPETKFVFLYLDFFVFTLAYLPFLIIKWPADVYFKAHWPLSLNLSKLSISRGPRIFVHGRKMAMMRCYKNLISAYLRHIYHHGMLVRLLRQVSYNK